MTTVISSRTPGGDAFRCPSCGAGGFIEPSRPPGDATCPACGQLIWPSPDDPMPKRGRIPPDRFEQFLRSERRRTMLGLRATALRTVGRLIGATRRLGASRARAEVTGVYDHWLDG